MYNNNIHTEFPTVWHDPIDSCLHFLSSGNGGYFSSFLVLLHISETPLIMHCGAKGEILFCSSWITSYFCWTTVLLFLQDGLELSCWFMVVFHSGTSCKYQESLGKILNSSYPKAHLCGALHSPSAFLWHWNTDQHSLTAWCSPTSLQFHLYHASLLATVRVLYKMMWMHGIFCSLLSCPRGKWDCCDVICFWQLQLSSFFSSCWTQIIWYLEEERFSSPMGKHSPCPLFLHLYS